MIPRKALFLALLALAPSLRAGEAALTADADKTIVALDDAVTVRVTLSGGELQGAQPDVPALDGFRAAFAGQSQNISFVNGRVSSEISFTYVLQPLAPGDRVIPPFTAKTGGKTLSTAPIPVKVVAAAGFGRTEPAAGGAAGARAARELFLTASLDKKTAVVGEAITLSVRFYSRVPLLSQPAYGPPALTGFLAEDLPPQRQFTESVEGRRYSVIELKTALFPAGPGAATVGPAALECRTNDFSDDPFGDDPFGAGFFQNFFAGGKPLVLKSEPLKIEVKPLPAAGRPAGFRGDVGRYGLTAALDKTRAALHEPVTLTVTISGEGNIKSLSTPAPPALPGFKSYETLSSLNISKTGWKVKGSKVFKTVLKPEVSGKLEVPPVSFSFFDPDARAYRTVKTPPLPLAVSGEAAPPEAGAAPPAAGVRMITRDIRYLKTGPLHRRRNPFP